MIRGAVFDVDGTLLDSMSIWTTIGADYLRSLGITPKEDLSQTFKTFSLYQSACYYQQVYGVKLSTDAIMDGVNQMVADFYQTKAPLKPGAAEFLRTLRQRGVGLCIATATDRPLVEAALERCGVLDCFSEIFTCTQVGRSKNEPHIFRAALAHLGTPKAETLVFEDAYHAAATAKRDGFPVAAVYDPSEDQQAALRALADCYITDFRSFHLP